MPRGWKNQRKDALKQRMRELKPHHRHEFQWGVIDGWPTYQTCRFCLRGHSQGLTGLWKYGARHWICDDCRTSIIGGRFFECAERRTQA